MRPDESYKQGKASHSGEIRQNKKLGREDSVIEAGGVQVPTPEQARRKSQISEMTPKEQHAAQEIINDQES